MPTHSSSSSSNSSRLSGSRGSRSMEGSGGGSSSAVSREAGDGGSSYNNNSHQSGKSHESSSPFTAARDRFQSSAQQLFKSLEDALGSSSRKDLDGTSGPAFDADRAGAALQPWETALRTMFSSCTAAADQNTVPDSGETLSSPRSSWNRKAPAAVVTPIEQRNKQSADGAHHSPIVQVQGGPPQKDLGEHIYAQLFFDDQIRAAKAVSGAGRGELDGIRTASHPMVSPAGATRQASHAPPSPFPLSTQASRIMLSNTTFGAVPTAAELDLTRTMTFDDSISAISAHTLEAMASANPTVMQQQQQQQQQPQRARSGESATLFPPETLLQQHQHQHQAREPPAAAAAANLGAAPSPFALEHHRSPSSNSRLSKYSHSTRTTESSSFDHWQQEDNKYWAEVAAQGDDPASSRRPSRKASTATTPTAQRKVRHVQSEPSKAAPPVRIDHFGSWSISCLSFLLIGSPPAIDHESPQPPPASPRHDPPLLVRGVRL
jgi:hypothetical protein